MHLKFYISRGLLQVATGSVCYEIRATSGRGICMNNPSKQCQKAHFEGPIPVGSYSLDPNDLDDPFFIRDIARRVSGDWGDWRIRLTPNSVAPTYGRANFYLHGGDRLGSGGCIDVGGGIWGDSNTNRLKKNIASARRVNLEVFP